MAAFALVTTVGPQPRPARSTPGEPGHAAHRPAFASLSYLTHRQVLRNPHIANEGRHDPDIHSLQRADKELKAPPALGGSAMVALTHQTANLCSKLNCASLPRPQGRACSCARSSNRIWRTTGDRCGTGPFPHAGVRGRSRPASRCSVTRPPSCCVTRPRAWSRTSILNRFASLLAGSNAERRSQLRRLESPAFGCGPSPSSAWVFNQFTPLRRQKIKNGVEQGHGTQSNRLGMKDLWPSASRFWKDQASVRNGQQPRS